MDGDHEKKHFSYPKRDELIDQIKELDDDIEHVSLNLIKCDFNATEKDVEKTFPEFNLIKVKNYNPGSFEVVFEMKIDAINFIRTCYDRKILTRRFYIKLGRQNKEVVEDWACVGYVPRKFNNPNPRKDFTRGPREDKPHHERREFHKREPNTDQPKDKEQASENKEQPKEHKEHRQHRQHKEHQHKPEHKAEHKVEHKERKPVVLDAGEKKVEAEKAEEKPKADTKGKQNKEAKESVAQESKKPAKVEEPKTNEEENDGWIQVPTKPKGKKK